MMPESSTDTPDEPTAAERPTLGSRIPESGVQDPDEILDLFLGWVADVGFSLYPAQEEAILELMAGRHVVLNTPTGSGKSLVALALHFKALCEGKRCYYTSPIKALASEKFFSLCDDLGADRVGMQTGDAAINATAPIVCCTAEVLSNAALRQGKAVGADYVVMDEFHYYSDPDRGVAWQIPLIALPASRFLLMSATLGNTRPITERIEARTGVAVSAVFSDERPVPLDYEYRETSLVETVQDLLDQDKAPIYIVNFTQRECAELAQSLTSLKLCTKDERKRIKKAIDGFRFDSPYGRECRRFLGFGVGVHHAGLLPKYRLLVEQLAQQGMLKVICGTDTLGVGVNIPIRTVLFTKLSKYDGTKVSLLKVRDFKQIAGRAGRKGFDEAGSIVAQAPEHVVETRRAVAKGGKHGRKKAQAKRPPPGFVSWDRQTFERLIAKPPEMLQSRFRLSHGMVLNLLQYDAESNDPDLDNFAGLRELISGSHEPPGRKERLIRDAAILVRSLHRSGVIRMAKDTDSGYLWAVVNEDLQWDFSLHQALSLYLVEALELLDPEEENYALDVASLVEAILEDPRVILLAQIRKRKDELIARLKAEGVPYEERMEKLEEVTPPRPNLAFIDDTFLHFRRAHPWVGGDTIRPKSIGREIYERYDSFEGYVRHYGLQRSEGVLLRHLSQVYKTLDQSVPEQAKTEPVYDMIGFIRTMLERIDSSLIEEWESLLHPELHHHQQAETAARQALRTQELLQDPKAFAARLRAELHQLVRALATHDYDDASRCVRLPEDQEQAWAAEDFERSMKPFYDDYETVVFDHDARQARRTRLVETGPRRWQVAQTVLDERGDNLWAIEGTVDLSAGKSLEGPLVEIQRIGP